MADDTRLGNVPLLFDQGELAEARARWEEALELKVDVEDGRGSAIVRLNLAGLLAQEGRLHAACEKLDGGIDALRATGDTVLLAEGLLVRGGLETLAGRLEEAVAACREAGRICEASGNPACGTRSKLCLAVTDLEAGASDRAVVELKKAAVALWGYEVWDKLDDIKIPTLVVGASKDKLHEPENLAKMVKMLPHSKYVDLETNANTHSKAMVDAMISYLKELN